MSIITYAQFRVGSIVRIKPSKIGDCSYMGNGYRLDYSYNDIFEITKVNRHEYKDKQGTTKNIYSYQMLDKFGNTIELEECLLDKRSWSLQRTLKTEMKRAMNGLAQAPSPFVFRPLAMNKLNNAT